MQQRITTSQSTSVRPHDNSANLCRVWDAYHGYNRVLVMSWFVVRVCTMTEGRTN